MENLESRPIPFVKHCGRTSADVKDTNEFFRLTYELTEKEQKAEYSRYYDLGVVEPSEENVRMTAEGAAISPAEGFMIENYVEHMDVEGGSDLRTGYCILPNGVGFSSATTIMNGCTAEIMSHFIENFNPPEDLYYKAWMPGAHMRHYEDMAIEDVGFGLAKLNFVEGLTAESIQMPQPAEHDKDNLGITGANILCWSLDNLTAEPIYISELCYYRLTEEGYEIRVNFWVGMHFVDGKSVLKLPDGKPVDEKYPRLLANHSVCETATFMRNVMQFWSDTK